MTGSVAAVDAPMVAPADATPTLLTPRVLIPFITVTLVWGSTWLVIRDQLSAVPPIWSVAYRFALAAIAMFALARWRGERLGDGWRGQRLALLLGISQFALNFNFVYRAEHLLTSGVVAVCYALLIVPNSLLSRLFLGTPIARRFAAGGAVAIIGVALLLANEAQRMAGGGTDAAMGALLSLGGLLAASSANVLQATRRARAQPMFALLAWAMLWGVAANALFALATVGGPVFDARPGYLGGLVYLALAGSVLCFPLYFGVIRSVGAGPAAWSGVLVPVVAMTLSTLVEGYQWTGFAIAGSILVFIGLVVALVPRRRRA